MKKQTTSSKKNNINKKVLVYSDEQIRIDARNLYRIRIVACAANLIVMLIISLMVSASYHLFLIDQAIANEDFKKMCSAARVALFDVISLLNIFIVGLILRMC
jgi:hypothetical protein